MSRAATLVGKVGIYAESASLPEGLFLGMKMEFEDGRVFRLCKNGGVALTSGKLVVRGDDVANHLSLTPVAATIGSKFVTVTLGATAATANQYKDGFLKLETGTQYKIKSHPAAALSTTLQVELYDGLWEAIAGSETCDLVASVYSGVIISVADQADRVVGVPMIDVTIAYYFWAQTHGPCQVLMDENVARGAAVTTGTSTVGAVEAVDAVAEPEVGYMIQAGVDTEYSQVYLTIE